MCKYWCVCLFFLFTSRGKSLFFFAKYFRKPCKDNVNIFSITWQGQKIKPKCITLHLRIKFKIQKLNLDVSLHLSNNYGLLCFLISDCDLIEINYTPYNSTFSLGFYLVSITFNSGKISILNSYPFSIHVIQLNMKKKSFLPKRHTYT